METGALLLAWHSFTKESKFVIHTHTYICIYTYILNFKQWQFFMSKICICISIEDWQQFHLIEFRFFLQLNQIILRFTYEMLCCNFLDPSHKAMTASGKYPQTHYFMTEIYRHAKTSGTKQYTAGYGTCALWDLCNMWVRSQNCGCLVTWFCYQLIEKSGNKTTTVSWLDPCILAVSRAIVCLPKR